jgi:hypothetical protein
MRRFDAFSFKKITAQELFDATVTGACLTVAGAVIILALVVAEFASYWSVSWTSEVRDAALLPLPRRAPATPVAIL